MLADHRPVGVPEGFTFVEIIVAVLIAGIFAAIVVFSVASVTHRGPDPVCTNDARRVQMAIAEYRLRNNDTNPATLGVLVKQKLLPVVPSPSTPSGAAGYSYDAVTGTYSGGSCPSK
jgi:prepilin-type N-terminal cleavage/methylation domain-containing protein